jgi:hypothetical protein
MSLNDPSRFESTPDAAGEEADSRAEARVTLHKMVRIRLVGGAVDVPPFSGCITGLSPRGVGLRLQRGIEIGREFELTVRDAEGIVSQLLYRTVQCSAMPCGHYQVGAELVRVLRPTSGAARAAAADVERILASRLAG